MTKRELVLRVSDETGISRADTLRVLNAVVRAIEAELAAGNSTTIRGFGTFSVKCRKSCMKGDITTPETITPVFNPSDTLRGIVNHK